jgi:hypothetical protein
MGLLDLLKGTQKTKHYSDANLTEPYDIHGFGTIVIPDKITELNAFSLSNSVSELFFCPDFLADRVSKLRFFIADKSGKEMQTTELTRFVTNINPFFSFNDIIYQSAFSYLSDGNSRNYLGTASAYKKITVNSITRVDVLHPDRLKIREFTNLSMLNIMSYNELIKEARYVDNTITENRLDIEKLSFLTIDGSIRANSTFLSRSPLLKAEKNVNTLLAAYSARYNVFANNGAAGYLCKKGSSAGLNDAIGGTRQDILDDLNKRNGITGNRNFWGISSIPLEMINTLLSIKDLMPFDETLEDSIKIAAVYQIPKNLVPRKDDSKYDNMLEAERTVWENALISLADVMVNYYTKLFGLDKVGYSIKADYSNVSALKTNQSTIEDVNAKTLANLEKMAQLDPSINISTQVQKIHNSYGN